MLALFGSRNKKHLRGMVHHEGQNISLGHNTDCSHIGLGQHNSLGEYCGPHAASEVVSFMLRSVSFILYICYEIMIKTVLLRPFRIFVMGEVDM